MVVALRKGAKVAKGASKRRLVFQLVVGSQQDWSPRH
jgi:hypothetical protein